MDVYTANTSSASTAAKQLKTLNSYASKSPDAHFSLDIRTRNAEQAKALQAWADRGAQSGKIADNVSVNVSVME